MKLHKNYQTFYKMMKHGLLFTALVGATRNKLLNY